MTSSSLLNKHLWEVISLHKALFLAKSTSNLLLRLAQLVGIKLFVRKVTQVVSILRIALSTLMLQYGTTFIIIIIIIIIIIN